MPSRSLFLLLCIAMSSYVVASPVADSTEVYKETYQRFMDSVNKVLNYETGQINLDGGKVSLNVPAGFKYLGKDQSVYVLVDLWGNPENSADEVLGMVFPENSDPFADSSYAFVVSYSEIGYVKDEDAHKINYDELLKNLQEEEKAENIERQNAGYSAVHLVGWAQKPYYDSERKILHWAKELKFDDNEGSSNTLNYQIRILGRKGILSLNAVSTMDQLPLVSGEITKVLKIASFTEGNAYTDFNPDIDEIATWTIGGLVAGKLLAKVGILAVIGKFLAPLWKFILIAILPLGAWFKRRFGRKKEALYATDVNAESGEMENRES